MNEIFNDKLFHYYLMQQMPGWYFNSWNLKLAIWLKIFNKDELQLHYKNYKIETID